MDSFTDVRPACDDRRYVQGSGAGWMWLSRLALRAMSHISNASFSANTSTQGHSPIRLGRRRPGNELREASVRRQPSLQPRPLQRAP